MADFLTKKENGRRLAIIILCAIAMAVSIACGIYAMKEAGFIAEDPENPYNIKALHPQLEENRRAIEDLERDYYAYAEPIGWFSTGLTTVDRFGRGPLDDVALKSFLSDIVRLRPEDAAKGRKSLFEILDIPGYKRWDDTGAGQNLLLTQLFDELLKKEIEYKTEIDNLKQKIAAEGATEKDYKTQMDAENKRELERLIGAVGANQPAQGHIGDLIRLMRDLNQLQKSHAEELAQLEKDTRDQQNKATETKNDYVRKRAASAAIKADYGGRINAITFHRAEERERREPDGQILGIDAAREIVYIDLLQKDRLFKGTKFRCYSLEKGGQKLDKGEVEVVEIRKANSSICAVVRVYDDDFPLKVGDKIYNELYEGGRTRRIAFAGRFTGRLSNQEAAALIREFGDIYQREVDEKTNYVVVAKGYEEHPNYKQALEYGIKILREPILYRYLGIPRE